MEDKHLVSVIIPTFNSEKFLERCLHSVEDQTYNNIEVIVVDNYSKDKTREILETHQARILLFRGIRSTARNVGAAAARGEYILSLDSDMELAPNVIAECVEKMDSEFDAIIVAEYSVGEGFWAKCKALEKSCYIGDKLIEAARFFRKDVFDAVNGYDGDLIFGEDWDLHLRICKAGYRSGRIRSCIKHHEGRLGLRESMLKKCHYVMTLEDYRSRNPIEARQQLKLIRPAFLRNWRKLARDPLHTSGMILMKTCEFTASGLVLLSNK